MGKQNEQTEQDKKSMSPTSYLFKSERKKKKKKI